MNIALTGASGFIGSVIAKQAANHGYWFYINDDDIQSKTTFLLMQVLMGMQSGASSSGAPILTIPVSG